MKVAHLFLLLFPYLKFQMSSFKLEYACCPDPLAHLVGMGQPLILQQLQLPTDASSASSTPGLGAYLA